jgi:hypothetical protein
MNLKKNVARLATAAMVLGMMVSYSPAVLAVSPTAMKDTMSRLEAAATSTHKVQFTTATEANWDNAETIVINYATAGFALTDGTPDCVIVGSGVCTAAAEEDDDLLTITCAEATGCAGAVTVGGVTPFSGTNPGAGSATVTFDAAGTSEYDDGDAFAVAIASNDQVTVAADVSPVIKFNVVTHTNCATDDTEIGSDDAIDFGVLTPGQYDADAGENVCMLLESSAKSGSVVEYIAANDGFTSATASYEMGQELTDGVLVGDVATAGEDGLFVSVLAKTERDYNMSGLVDSLTEDAAYSGAVGGTTGVPVMDTAFDVLAASTTPVDGGTDSTHSYNAVTVQLGAFASYLTPTATDYTNTLTFRATGTF